MVANSSTKPDFSLERSAKKQGYPIIAGIDEAGRGPWAGPVVAAAVVLSQGCIPDGLDDSKKLPQAKRERLFGELEHSADIGIGVVSVQEIDAGNILKATLRAMTVAFNNLPKRADFALIDGNRAPGLSCPLETIVKGDARSLSIAAASIIAKVTRDQMMVDMALGFPGYGFERHKGYGTRQHREALAKLGPCIHHRKSFAPIRAFAKKTKNAPR